MAAPTCRVLARTYALCLSGIEHVFNSAAKALGGLTGSLPEWLQNSKDIARADCLEHTRAYRSRIFREGHRLLRGVLGITPRWPHRFNIGVSNFTERLLLLLLSGRARIASVGEYRPQRARFFPRIR